MVLFTKKQCLIMQDNDSQTILATSARDLRNGLYKFESSSNSYSEANYIYSSTKQAEIHLWHRHYGHLHYDGLYHLSQKDKVRGLPYFKMTHHICLECMAGCQHRERFPKASLYCASHVLALIHTDLVGPLATGSLSGSRYFIVFTNDYTQKSWVYFLRTKGEAFQKFREFKNRIEKEIGQRILTLRSDRGGEYLSREFIIFCKNEGISQQLTMACTPQQNGVAE
jgi:hypothetical protein